MNKTLATTAAIGVLITSSSQFSLGDEPNPIEVASQQEADPSRTELTPALVDQHPAGLVPEGAVDQTVELVSFDPATGEEVRWARPEVSPPSSLEGLSAPEQPPAVAVPAGLGERGSANSESQRYSSDATGQEIAIELEPVEFPHSFPWSSIFQLQSRFSDGVSINCTAFALGSFHLLTAGTCIYNHDHGGFPVETRAWAGQSNSIPPFGPIPSDSSAGGIATPWADHPFGEARAARYWTFAAWRDSRDPHYNVAYVALNRRDGDHTGWMGRETNVEAASLNYAGYPRVDPFPTDNLSLWRDFGTVAGYTSTNIVVAAVDVAGMNGMPYWRFADGERRVQGWSSNTINGAPAPLRITNAVFDDIQRVLSQDAGEIPPVARPDLIEYLFDGGAGKDVNKTKAGPHFLAPGDKFTVQYNVFNSGFADSGEIQVDFRMSTNNFISTTDRRVATTTLSNLGAYTFTTRSRQIKIPRNLPAGTYFAGWIMSAENAEYSTDNNTAVVDIKNDQPEIIVVVPYKDDLQLRYSSGKLGMDFTLATPKPVKWNATLVSKDAIFPMFDIELPTIQTPTSVPVPPSTFPQVGQMGVVTTLRVGTAIVAMDWQTVDTAPPTTGNCSLQVTGSYTNPGLSLNVNANVGTGLAIVSRWNLYVVNGATVSRVSSTQVLGSFSRVASVPGVSSTKLIGVVTTITTPTDDIVCSDFATIGTGG